MQTLNLRAIVEDRGQLGVCGGLLGGQKQILRLGGRVVGWLKKRDESQQPAWKIRGPLPC